MHERPVACHIVESVLENGTVGPGPNFCSMVRLPDSRGRGSSRREREAR